MNKVLLHNDAFLPLTETFIYEQMLGTSKNHHITVVARAFLNEDIFPLPGTTRIRIPSHRDLPDRISSFFYRKFFATYNTFSLAFSQQLARYIRDNEVKIIHAHFGMNGVAILPVAKRTKTPLIVSFHGYDASTALANKTYKRSLTQLFEFAEKIIIVSPHMMDSLGLKKYEAKVSIIPYGVDSTFFTAKPRKENSTIKLLHAGRLTPKKGILDLVLVFSKLTKRIKSIELYIMGEGEEMSKCLDLVEKLNLSSFVHFIKADSRKVVKQLMEDCDIFVLNSRTSENGDMEGLPNALLEAMSMGMAVVSTVHAGIPLVIKNHNNGILVPEKDNNRLEAELDKLVKDAALRKILGREARRTILERFDVKMMNSKLDQIFKECLHEAAG